MLKNESVRLVSSSYSTKKPSPS